MVAADGTLVLVVGTGCFGKLRRCLRLWHSTKTGNLYIAEPFASRFRKVAQNIITALAGIAFVVQDFFQPIHWRRDSDSCRLVGRAHDIRPATSRRHPSDVCAVMVAC